MNSDILKGKWTQLKGSARHRWGALTDDDLDKIQGDGEKLIGVLQETYGRTREWAEREMNEFLNSANADGAASGSLLRQYDHELDNMSSEMPGRERFGRRRAS